MHAAQLELPQGMHGLESYPIAQYRHWRQHKNQQLAVDSNLMGYEVGVRVGIDVLQVQSQLSETMQQLSRARYDTLLAQLRLKAAVGALQEKDVEDINALLQHCPHNSKDMDCPDPTVRKHST